MAYRKRRPLGIVPDVQPEGSCFWDGSQMTPFHNKLMGCEPIIPTINIYYEGDTELGNTLHRLFDNVFD